VIADPLFEIGMMRLFGGFPDACEAALVDRLAEVGGEEMLHRSEVRIELGRLHHLLNHWLIFGRDYAPPAMRCVAELAG
jgi:fructosamine-3-kinase